MRRNKNEKVILGVLATTALVLVGGVVWMAQRIYAGQETVSKNGQEIAQKEMQQERLVALATLANDLSDIREEVAAQFITLDNEVVFIEAIETAARESGTTLEIKRVNFEDVERVSRDEAGNEQREKIGEELVLMLDADGSWREVFHFVSLVETLALGLHIRHTQFGIIDDPEIPDKWRATLILALRVRT